MTRTRQALVLLALLAPGRSFAQPAPPFADLGLTLNLGDRVRVVDRAGARHDGRLDRLAADAIVVTVDGRPRTFTAEGVARIARRGDAVLNGLVIGALAGGALGVAFVNGFSDHSEPASSYLLMSGILGGAGAGLGGLVDALHTGQHTVYVAPATQATVVPVVGRRAVGAAATWRW